MRGVRARVAPLDAARESARGAGRSPGGCGSVPVAGPRRIAAKRVRRRIGTYATAQSVSNASGIRTDKTGHAQNNDALGALYAP